MSDNKPKLLPPVDGTAGDVIRPYLSADGAHFAVDFWVADRIGAMAGASVKDYEQMLVMLGMLGSIGRAEDGRRPAHLFIVGPDDPDRLPNEVMTSPGTPVDFGGPGWDERGEFYAYDPDYSHGINFAAWCRAGAPKANAYGRWANGGLPQGYVEETWKGVADRNLNQPGWPGYGRRRRLRRE